MKRRSWVALSIATAVLLIPVGFTLWSLSTMEGLEDDLMLAIAGEDTIYANAYSEENFASVRDGMTEAQVLAILGQPLDRMEVREPAVDQVYYFYSRGGNRTGNYRMRVIMFANGLVAEVTSGAEID